MIINHQLKFIYPVLASCSLIPHRFISIWKDKNKENRIRVSLSLIFSQFCGNSAVVHFSSFSNESKQYTLKIWPNYYEQFKDVLQARSSILLQELQIPPYEEKLR